MNIPYVFKRCTKCNKLLVANNKNFAKQKGGKWGLRSICKQCNKKRNENIKEYRKKYYEDNKEHYNQYNKEYYQNNKEYFKNYYESNKEYYKEYRKEWYKNNKDYYKNYYADNIENLVEYHKEYYKDNKEYMREQQKVYRALIKIIDEGGD